MEVAIQILVVSLLGSITLLVLVGTIYGSVELVK
jgi:hypothetical protein